MDQETLRAALTGYKLQRDTLDLKIAELKAQIHSIATPAKKTAGRKLANKKRTSAKMAAAQKARWARFREERAAKRKKATETQPEEAVEAVAG